MGGPLCLGQKWGQHRLPRIAVAGGVVLGLFLYCMSLLAPFVLFYQQGHLDVVSWFLGVITLRVPLSLDKVLQLFFPPITLVAPDGLDFILFSVVNKVRQRSRVVLSMFFCF